MSKTLVRDETIPEAPSVDPAEIEKFRKMAADWCFKCSDRLTRQIYNEG